MREYSIVSKSIRLWTRIIYQWRSFW